MALSIWSLLLKSYRAVSFTCTVLLLCCCFCFPVTLDRAWKKLELISLELLSACFLNNRGRTPPPPHTHTTHMHTHTTTASLPPLFPELALFRLFLFFSFFSSSEKGDSMTAFPASCGLEPGGRKLCYSLRLQLWEEVTTSSPDSVHARSGRHTRSSGLDHSSNRESTETVRAACSALLFFKFGGKED